MKKLGFYILLPIICFSLSINLLAQGESVLANQPVLAQPEDNVTGIYASPFQQITVSDPDYEYIPDVSSYGLATGIAPGADFSIVLIPDCQNESQYYPSVLVSMTNWIVAQQSNRNIVFVTTSGDMVNNASSITEYANADVAMDKLDPAGIPYSVGVGNHDQPTTNFNSYFGVTRFAGKSWYGGHYGNTNDNSVSLFKASGMEFMIINLEINPSSAILDWADALLKENPNRRVIVESHSILNIDNSWTNQGIFTALKDNPNLFLMICGHMHSSSDGAAYRSESGDDGHTIHIMLADYQEYPNGGNGYMRILRFSPASDKIYITTYSPYANTSITTFPDQMEVVYDMADGTKLPPASYSVTGSGSYCHGGFGLPIGLTNSEVDVTYTLYKNNVPLTPTLAGTGSAISFGNQPAGTYTVSGSNSGGNTTMQGSAIIVENPTPVTPIITFNSNILHSNATNGNQWYNGSGSINGATGQSYIPTAVGNYYVIVSSGVCSSDPSNTINVVLTGIEKTDFDKTINLYPNPTDGKATLSFKGEKPGKITVEVLNMKGQSMKIQKLEVSENQTEINLKGLPKGTYFVKIVTSGDTVIKTVILQ